MTTLTADTPKDRIRRAMDAQGETYKSLGNEIGITTQAVSEIVNGRTTGATARYALARALRKWPEDFWWEE